MRSVIASAMSLMALVMLPRLAFRGRDDPANRRQERKSRLAAICTLLIVTSTIGAVSSRKAAASAQDISFHVSSTVPPAVDTEIRTSFQQALDFLSNELGFTLARSVAVFVYGSQREGLEGLMSDFGYSEANALAIARRAPFIAFSQRIYINAGDLFFREASRRIARARIITHELAHIYHNDLMGGTPAAPLWIKEGFAVRFELKGAEQMGFHPTTETAQEFLNLTQTAFRQGNLMPFHDLETAAQWDRRIELFSASRVYGQAFAAVDYLFQTKGQQAVLSYFRAFRASKDPELNFASSFGFSTDAFQREFEAYLTSLRH